MERVVEKCRRSTDGKKSEEEENWGDWTLGMERGSIFKSLPILLAAPHSYKLQQPPAD